MSSQMKQILPTSSAVGLVDLPRLDCETPPISLHETQRDDTAAHSSRSIAALVFYLFQDLRLSQEKQKRRFDELEERTNCRLDNLEKTLDDRQKRHKDHVEEVLRRTQKCAADIEELAQAQAKADGIYARDERLKSEVTRLDERLNLSGNELQHLNEAVCSCADKKNFEALLETKVQERLQDAEKKIMRQNKTLLDLSEELRRLKEEMRALEDQTRKTSKRRTSATVPRKVVDKPSRPETEPGDIYTAETQPLEQPILKFHYNLRPRSQPPVEKSEMVLAVSTFQKTSPIAPIKSHPQAGRKSPGTRTTGATGKTIGVEKRTAAASDTDNVLNHLPSSKRRKRPSPQTNLAKICCEAQWAYEKCPDEQSEHEFIAEFLKFSMKNLSPVDKKQLMEALGDLATTDIHGMPIFRQDTDWSDIWERLWTIKDVPGMYLRKSKRV
ncbi:hypothetical protein MCOR07_008071 [Pyricularia oryzae]|uniref:Uncharacterized protein n=2 Tax=Pyricularia TaxID=48558 RepID=A0ABQ8NE41_PYRGI|nr:hypothetical protein MCOR01_007560 [Pyricularia oryzae]KAI6295554.1 hypothetical protein MCOR33_007572 [Pyricularia grisea]KAI6254286.1 hypothetical protein MCOR19_009200 [Pyricularia oryzae]KAI6284858.1 hypothetical protein MCOR26_001754 [Pyricularia oryzae]KAI6314612.1 hypothetical protein MCOR34_004899 [Pyricularia oryzae]